jgi:hypothetical protein
VLVVRIIFYVALIAIGIIVIVHLWGGIGISSGGGGAP